MNVYVGNLPSDVTGNDLREAFEPFGQIDTAYVMKHRHGGGSGSFGFVDMPARSEAISAIVGLDGKNLKGRAITATEVRPRDPVCGACRTPCYGRSPAQATGNARPISAASPKEEGGNNTGMNRSEQGQSFNTYEPPLLRQIGEFMTTHRTTHRNAARIAGNDVRSGNTEIIPLPAASSEQTQPNTPIVKPCSTLQAIALTRDLIAERAQAIWLKCGCPRNRDEENWREAETQLKTEMGTV